MGLSISTPSSPSCPTFPDSNYVTLISLFILLALLYVASIQGATYSFNHQRLLNELHSYTLRPRPPHRLLSLDHLYEPEDTNTTSSLVFWATFISVFFFIYGSSSFCLPHHVPLIIQELSTKFLPLSRTR